MPPTHQKVRIARENTMDYHPVFFVTQLFHILVWLLAAIVVLVVVGLACDFVARERRP